MIDLPAGKVPGLALGGMTLRQDAVGHGRKAATIIHIMVADLDVTTERILASGGSIDSEVMEIPAGPFVYASDTEGNTIGVWQPAAP